MKGHLKTILGVAISVLLLWWALKDVSMAEVLHHLREADPFLLTAAVVTTVIGFLIRAVRWGVLLMPVAPGLPLRPRFAAVSIGAAGNNLIPARVGEFARALVLTRITPVPIGASVATIVVERVLDGIALAALLFLALASPSFPGAEPAAGIDPRSAGRAAALVMLGVGIVLYIMVLAPVRSMRLAHAVVKPLPARIGELILSALESFLDGLKVLRSGWLSLASIALAIGQWAFTGWGFLLAFQAFGIEAADFVAAIFLQSLIAFAVAIPSSPGFFGPFEAASKIGLGLWGVPAGQAVSFAVGFHIASFAPITIIGLYYAWRLNLSWSEVRHSEKAVEEEVEHEVGHHVAHVPHQPAAEPLDR